MPKLELTPREIDLINEALRWSKTKKQEGSAPVEVKQADVAAIDEVLAKLKAARS